MAARFSRGRLRVMLGLAALAPVACSGAELALLVGEDSSQIQAAAAAIEGLEDVRVSRFDIFKGITQTDAALSRLKRFPFDGVVSLGEAAHQLYVSQQLNLRYRATLLGDRQGSDIVPSEAPPSQWVDLLEALVPGKRKVAALVASAEAEGDLAGLSRALSERGLSLDVIAPNGGEDLEEAAARAIQAAPVFFLQRDKELMKRKVLLRLLNDAHARKVAILGFSSSLVKAGALAALEVTPEEIGRYAAELALGREPSAIEGELSINEKRASYLGLEIPASLRRRMK